MSKNGGFLLFVVLIIGLGILTGSLTIDVSFLSYRPMWHDSTPISLTGSLYVSPYAGDDFLLDVIAGARESIDIQTYDFTNRDIRILLEQKLQEGVTVRLMMEDQKFRQFRDSYEEVTLLYSGYDTFAIQSDRGLDTRYLHSKYVIVDGQIAIIQSANLTYSAFENREHSVVVTQSGFVGGLQSVFDADWVGNPLSIDVIHPNILLCPVDCRDDIISLIDQATGSIWIQTQYISDDLLTMLLQDRVNEFDMKIIVADTDESQEFIDYFGPEIVRALDKPYVHTKTMLIDDRWLMVGSINFSSNSMDNNREVAVLLDDPVVIGLYKQYFWQDWENSL